MKNFTRIILTCFIFFFAGNAFSAEKYYNYLQEMKAIETLLKSFEVNRGQLHICTKEEVESLLKAGYEQGMNLFEILYTAYSYLEKINVRISMKGSILRELESKFSYGNERVYSLIPIGIVDEVQVGPTKEADKHVLDLFFSKTYEKYIEIGTAIYDKHIGFGKIEKNALANCFGMSVKKIGLKKNIDRIVLNEKNRIAIYVKKFPIPKRWNIPAVSLK